MANDEQPPAAAENLDAIKQKSSQVDALQNQLGNILSGVEKSLAVTCESIMGKMKQLEDKIQDMEKRCTELAKDAEQTLRDVDKMEQKSESTPTIQEAGEPAADTTQATVTEGSSEKKTEATEADKQ